jgi:hypothetical protein
MAKGIVTTFGNKIGLPMNGRISAWVVNGGFHKRLSIERKELLQNTERGDAQGALPEEGHAKGGRASKINHAFCTSAHYFRSQYTRVQRLVKAE